MATAEVGERDDDDEQNAREHRQDATKVPKDGATEAGGRGGARIIFTLLRLFTCLCFIFQSPPAHFVAVSKHDVCDQNCRYLKDEGFAAQEPSHERQQRPLQGNGWIAGQDGGQNG